jgi:hypothetical protein
MQTRELSVPAAVPSLAVAFYAVLAACGGCHGPHGATSPGDDAGAEIDGGLGRPGDAGVAIGPLRVDPSNPRYFTDGSGRAVYLTGSHTWGNFKDRALVDPPPAFDYDGFLNFLVDHHHNFIRLWTWEQPHSSENAPQDLMFAAQFPWLRTGPGTASDGKPKFNLDQLDPAYFSRLRARVTAARDRGIYVSVMLFDGWDLVNGYNAASGGFPLASGNNVNGVAVAGAAAYAPSNSAALARQKAYVNAVIDAVNDLDNVLYEIANETDASGVAWQYQMIDYVKAVEASKPKQHPVGMTSTYPGSDDDLFASHADWISPNTRLVLSDGHKVILNDTDHSYGYVALQNDGPDKRRAWAWETLCIGASPLFMDPYDDPWSGRNDPVNGALDPSWNDIRNVLGYTRIYADRLNLERALPSSDLCSTGYCLAEPGHQYLVYQPSSGGFTLNVAAGAYQFEWVKPATGTVAASGMMTLPTEQHTFTPPFNGDAVLLLLQ